MKHADDQTNERLRKALADRFKTIHDEPDPALAKIVLGSISSRSPFAKPVGFALIALLTICISIAVDDQKLPAGLHRTVGKTAEMRTGKFSPKPEYHIEKEQVRSIEKGNYLTSQHSNLLLDSPDKETAEMHSPGIPPALLQTENQQTINALELLDHTLQLLDNTQFRNNTAMKMPEIKNVAGKASVVSSKNHWNVLVGFMPMNTSQVVRIGSQQQAMYQNFSFPTNLSRKKIAYKFQAGIENRGFQVLLHYSQVRQMFDYELATKEFVLDNKGNPIRKGLHRELNETLHFVGAGLRKNFKLDEVGLSAFYIHTGLDFSRELSSRQNALWATAGIGKEIRLDRNTSIMAGPYLEYALNKLAAGDAGFQVQPYQIGFSIQLKYKINH